MPQYIFVAEKGAGTVSFYVDKLHGCCGVGVISYPQFRTPWKNLDYDKQYKVTQKTKDAQLNKLFKQFNQFIKDPKLHSRRPLDLQRSKIIMTGYKGHDVYKFGMYAKWDKSLSFQNEITGRWLYIFSYTRTQRKKK